MVYPIGVPIGPPYILVFGQVEDFLSMYNIFLLLIANSNMHWLNYI